MKCHIYQTHLKTHKLYYAASSLKTRTQKDATRCEIHSDKQQNYSYGVVIVKKNKYIQKNYLQLHISVCPNTNICKCVSDIHVCVFTFVLFIVICLCVSTYLWACTNLCVRLDTICACHKDLCVRIHFCICEILNNKCMCACVEGPRGYLNALPLHTHNSCCGRSARTWSELSVTSFTLRGGSALLQQYSLYTRHVKTFKVKG